MPLLDQIHAAQAIKYVPPPGKAAISDFTEEEVFEAMLANMLKDPTITYGIIMGCKKHLPVKILVKQLLNRYVTKFK